MTGARPGARRWVVAGVIAVALALAGCGRSSGEDPATPTSRAPVPDDLSLEVPVTADPVVDVPVTTPKQIAKMPATVPPKKPCTIKATAENDTLGFQKNSAVISPAGSELLTRFTTQALHQTRRLGRIQVLGHASSEGNDAYNLDLSQRRADAVVAVLRRISQLGSAPISAEGKGETQPIADNGTEAGRQANRRVEIYLHFTGCESDR